MLVLAVVATRLSQAALVEKVATVFLVVAVAVLVTQGHLLRLVATAAQV